MFRPLDGTAMTNWIRALNLLKLHNLVFHLGLHAASFKVVFKFLHQICFKYLENTSTVTSSFLVKAIQQIKNSYYFRVARNLNLWPGFDSHLVVIPCKLNLAFLKIKLNKFSIFNLLWHSDMSLLNGCFIGGEVHTEAQALNIRWFMISMLFEFSWWGWSSSNSSKLVWSWAQSWLLIIWGSCCGGELEEKFKYLQMSRSHNWP